MEFGLTLMNRFSIVGSNGERQGDKECLVFTDPIPFPSGLMYGKLFSDFCSFGGSIIEFQTLELDESDVYYF